MVRRILHSSSRCLLAGAVCAAVLTGIARAAESDAVPNFAPDSRTGWIAGDPNGVSPVGQDVQSAANRTPAQAAMDPRRAPLNPVSAPENVQIADLDWAWHVTWEGGDGAVHFQIYAYDAAQGWTLLTSTSANQFNVPKTYTDNYHYILNVTP